MLAALDWNLRHSEREREAVLDSRGHVVHDVVFSKRRKTWVLRVRYNNRHAPHVQPLVRRVLEVHHNRIELPPVHIPGTVPKHVPTEVKPCKEQLLEQYTTHFVVSDS